MSTPNKRSREEIAKTQRANLSGNGYRPIQPEEEEPEVPEEKLQVEQNTVDTEEEIVNMRCYKLLIDDLCRYHTEGKEVNYIQLYHTEPVFRVY